MAKLSKDPTFTYTDQNSPITEFALPLVGAKGDDWAPLGTAVTIAPYLAITARHVIEHCYQVFERLFPEEVESAATFSIFASQIINEGEKAALWDAAKMWLSPATDVAFLGLRPASEEAASLGRGLWRSVSMDLLPPSVGDRVSAFGYHSADIELLEQGGKKTIQYSDSPATSVGEVAHVYEHYRDSSMLRFPCFEINTRSEPGMSGGPVFNDDGRLCGIICMGDKAGEENSTSESLTYYYYATTLWLSMGTLLDMDREGFPSGVRYPALDLARHGLISARGWERVRVNISSSSIEVALLPKG